jgi:hypothetical protein
MKAEREASFGGAAERTIEATCPEHATLVARIASGGSAIATAQKSNDLRVVGHALGVDARRVLVTGEVAIRLMLRATKELSGVVGGTRGKPAETLHRVVSKALGPRP